jgi:hypothetical protein
MQEIACVQKYGINIRTFQIPDLWEMNCPFCITISEESFELQCLRNLRKIPI